MLYSGHFSFDELRENDREGTAITMPFTRMAIPLRHIATGYGHIRIRI